MFVGAVYDRALFLESTKYARSQTAPTADSSLLGQPPDIGGVDATSRRSREASFDGADGREARETDRAKL